MQVGLATVGYQLKRAQQALRAALGEALRPHGLTTPQYAALTALVAEAGLSGAELARRCFVTPQTMNEIVAGLEARGWVTRRPHAAHGRVLQTFLTDQGAAALASGHAVVGAVEERMLAGLGVAEREELAARLAGCAERLAPRAAN